MTRGTADRRALLVDVLTGATGVLLLGRQIVNALHAPGIDFVHIWNAAHQVVSTGGGYADPLFTYPPSSALLMAPLGELPYDGAKTLMVVINVISVVAAAWLSAALLRRPSRRVVAVGLLGLGVADAVASTWANGNINGPLVLLEVVALRAICSERWLRAAVLVGVTLALKPVLLPMLLLFALRRKWPELAVALLLPCLTSVVGLVALQDGSRFFSVVVPFLAHGAQLPFNDSFVGAGYLLGLPGAATAALRLGTAAAAVTVFTLWARERDAACSPQRVCWEVGAALAVTFLVAPMSETYYTIYLMPAITAWAMTSHRHAWSAVVAVAAFFATFRLPGHAGAVAVSVPLALRPTLGWLLCLAVFAAARRSERPAPGIGRVNARRRPQPRTHSRRHEAEVSAYAGPTRHAAAASDSPLR